MDHGPSNSSFFYCYGHCFGTQNLNIWTEPSYASTNISDSSPQISLTFFRASLTLLLLPCSKCKNGQHSPLPNMKSMLTLNNAASTSKNPNLFALKVKLNTGPKDSDYTKIYSGFFPLWLLPLIILFSLLPSYICFSLVFFQCFSY